MSNLTGKIQHRVEVVRHQFRPDEHLLVLQVEADGYDGDMHQCDTNWRDATPADLAHLPNLYAINRKTKVDVFERLPEAIDWLAHFIGAVAVDSVTSNKLRPLLDDAQRAMATLRIIQALLKEEQ